ncbi:NAD-dependent epimerase/dehydratase family protein [Haliscomenobacter sp.]|uniref:NAD-dependent epimerase/dehydratase family protein n=1 Tax=Haliscomenobacter sp. TaxID=2717303 RepID=UPI003BA8AC5A
MIKRVLVTGVAGFIGSNLLDFLIDNTDWEITGIDNLSTGTIDNIKHNLENERFIFKKESCSSLQSLKSFQCIFHLAALPRIQPSFEEVNEHIVANLNESIHVLELMIKENYFPRLVYSSSSAIYGTPETTPTNEEESIKCLSPYAFQKYEVEKYLELLSTRYPIDYINLRYFNPYGPRSFNPNNKFNAYSSVIGIFLDKKKNGQPLQITGDGTQRRDFVHVADLANANYLAAIYPERINTSFNIGHGSTFSIVSVAQMISSNIEFIAKREGEAEITFSNINKAEKILKWVPTYGLVDYLRKCLDCEELG